jgi:carboxyl-terminal processing protease
VRRALLLLLLLAVPAAADQPSCPTLAFALEAIRDRALYAYKLDAVALEGLQGLSAIDPAFDAGRGADGRVRLRYRSRDLASYAAPAGNDAGGWAALLDQAAREAARVSPAIGKADGDRLTEAIIDGFLSRTDVFSHYAGPHEAPERRAARSGFGGIGVRYEVEPGFITVTEIIADSPAAQAKLKTGDHILAIDSTRLAGLEVNDLTQLLRGPIGSPIKLTLQRGAAAPVTLSLRRSLILPTTVSASIEDGIGVIAVSGFNEETADRVEEAVKKANASPGLKGIVLDLRGNPGGLLDQGVAIADLFIAEGQILAAKGRHPAAAQRQTARPGDIGETVQLVVLVDGRTASAAEILASDLQDSGRAVLIGTNSYGKGAIQTVLDLPNGGEMTLTWSRFYAPSGYALHGLGVLPNICTAAGGKVDAALAASWRAAAPDDMAQRLKLRRHCPAADHVDDRGDLAIAKKLLNDRKLYARALAAGAPVSTASTQRPLSQNVH